MKKFAFIVLLFSFTSGFAQELEKPRQEMTAEVRALQRAETLKIKLQLNDQQFTQLKIIFLESFQQKEAIRAQMKTNKENTKARLKATLTTDQYEHLLEIREQRMGKRHCE